MLAGTVPAFDLAENRGISACGPVGTSLGRGASPETVRTSRHLAGRSCAAVATPVLQPA